MAVSAKRIFFRLKQNASMWGICSLAFLVSICSFFGELYIDLSRAGAVIALVLQITVEIRSCQRRFLTSPLFLLSIIGVFFFSVVQVIWVLDGPWPTETRDFTLFVGSQAEAVILAFCMACLVVYVIVSRKLCGGISQNVVPLPSVSKKTIGFLLIVPLIFLLFDLVIFLQSEHEVIIPQFIIKLHFIVPPIIALSLCFLMRAALISGWLYKIGLFIQIGFVLGGLVYVGESKIVIFIFISLLFYGLRLFDFTFSRFVLVTIVAILFFLTFVQIIQHTSWKVGMISLTPTSTSYSRIFLGKGVWRQTETGYCFNNVIAAHTQDPFELSKQTFWLEGLLPRAFWPDKPSLSRGNIYASKYCLSHDSTLLNGHSASITLLGQPIVQGGLIGLVLHAGVLLLVLAGVEKLNRGRTTFSTALVVALLPWLIDFDQDFAMYVANAVKFALVMLILFIPIVLIERRDINGHLA